MTFSELIYDLFIDQKEIIVYLKNEHPEFIKGIIRNICKDYIIINSNSENEYYHCLPIFNISRIIITKQNAKGVIQYVPTEKKNLQKTKSRVQLQCKGGVVTPINGRCTKKRR